LHSAFIHNQYLLKRQVLALTGKFRLYDPNGLLVLYGQQKIFKLKEDIRLFSDESMSQALLHIQARQIIDFSAAYDVFDPIYNSQVGTLRRKGFRSFLRDQWDVLDSQEQPLGVLLEDNPTRAFLRRLLLGTLLPQDYDLFIGEQKVADFKQRFNILRYDMDLDFSLDTTKQLDRRIGIAAAILLGTIEGKQHS